MTNNNILTYFGSVIRTLRINKGFSQEQLAFKAGLHRTYIGFIERGEKNITLLNIKKLASALDCSISEIFLLMEEKYEKNFR
ncbi:MAG: helix-turn-helix transcriptional regulator [Candidatus Bathyarchaeia archaeon]